MTGVSVAALVAALLNPTPVRLVSYRHVWRTKDDYVYECTWSDGEITIEHTLPWGNLGMSGHPLGGDKDMAHHRRAGQQVPKDHATPPA